MARDLQLLFWFALFSFCFALLFCFGINKVKLMIFKVILTGWHQYIAITNYNNPTKLHLTNMVLAQRAPQKGDEAKKNLTPS